MSSLRYYYLRDSKSVRIVPPGEDGAPEKLHRGDPVACLVSSYDPKNLMVRFALSVCSPGTSFDKKLFRTMAEVRLKQRSLSLTFEEVPTGHDINKKIMAAIVGASDACKLKRRTDRQVKHNNNVSSFSNFLKRQVAEGKKLFDVLDAVEAKSSSDWRQKVSERAGVAAREWLAQADVPREKVLAEKKDTIPSPPPVEMKSPLPPMKAPPVPSITASITAKVDKLVAANSKR